MFRMDCEIRNVVMKENSIMAKRKKASIVKIETMPYISLHRLFSDLNVQKRRELM
jgi:hypothetical protein